MQVSNVEVEIVVLKHKLVAWSTALELPQDDEEDAGSEEEGSGFSEDEGPSVDDGPSVDLVGSKSVLLFGSSSSLFSIAPESCIMWFKIGPISLIPALTLSATLSTSLIAQDTRLKREAVHPPELEAGGTKRWRKPFASEIVPLNRSAGGAILSSSQSWAFWCTSFSFLFKTPTVELAAGSVECNIPVCTGAMVMPEVDSPGITICVIVAPEVVLRRVLKARPVSKGAMLVVLSVEVEAGFVDIPDGRIPIPSKELEVVELVVF